MFFFNPSRTIIFVYELEKKTLSRGHDLEDVPKQTNKQTKMFCGVKISLGRPEYVASLHGAGFNLKSSSCDKETNFKSKTFFSFTSGLYLQCSEWLAQSTTGWSHSNLLYTTTRVKRRSKGIFPSNATCCPKRTHCDSSQSTHPSAMHWNPRHRRWRRLEHSATTEPHHSSTRFFRMISRTSAVTSSRMLSIDSSVRQKRTTFPSGFTRNFQKFHRGIFCTESETRPTKKGVGEGRNTNDADKEHQQ